MRGRRACQDARGEVRLLLNQWRLCYFIGRRYAPQFISRSASYPPRQNENVLQDS
jgi:hypothetical protein